MRSGLFIMVLLLAGCASDQQQPGIGSDSSNVAVVKHGVIEGVTPIEMDASSDSTSSAGGLFGQVGGANTGGGRGAVVGTILGSVLGTTLGHQAGIATKPGLEIWVKLDGEENRSIYVMQPGKPDAFKAGDRVRVLRKNGEVRVEPMQTGPAPAKEAPKEPPKP